MAWGNLTVRQMEELHRQLARGASTREAIRAADVVGIIDHTTLYRRAVALGWIAKRGADADTEARLPSPDATTREAPPLEDAPEIKVIKQRLKEAKAAKAAKAAAPPPAPTEAAPPTESAPAEAPTPTKGKKQRAASPPPPPPPPPRDEPPPRRSRFSPEQSIPWYLREQPDVVEVSRSIMTSGRLFTAVRQRGELLGPLIERFSTLTAEAMGMGLDGLTEEEKATRQQMALNALLPGRNDTMGGVLAALRALLETQHKFELDAWRAFKSLRMPDDMSPQFDPSAAPGEAVAKGEGTTTIVNNTQINLGGALPAPSFDATKLPTDALAQMYLVAEILDGAKGKPPLPLPPTGPVTIEGEEAEELHPELQNP